MLGLVLSHFQVKPLISAWSHGLSTVITSIDLNLSICEAALSENGVTFPSRQVLTWANAEIIVDNPNKCFKLMDDEIREIAGYSEVTGWPRSLFPTNEAPTMLVSGLTMHRIQGIGPHADTLRKIKSVAPIGGRVLDTATGLGYTAIEAAKTADVVTTVELDPLSIEIARENPWSQELFSNNKIQQVIADVFDVVEKMEDDQLSVVIHDPPMFSLAGDLYSREFYSEIYRVLKRRGRMFHYVGDLSSKSGSGVLKGVTRRLGEVGFARILRKPDAFGVVAFK